MKYLILFPLNGELNLLGTLNSHSYEKVAEVEATSINCLLQKAHDMFIESCNRGLSKGDIIVETDDATPYMVEDTSVSLLCNCDHLIEHLFDYKYYDHNIMDQGKHYYH